MNPSHFWPYYPNQYLPVWNEETADVAVPGGVWAQPDAPRRSVSMMHDPRYFSQQQKAFGYQEQMSSCAQYNNSGYYPDQQAAMQQHGNFYSESPSCMNGGGAVVEEPVYDPRRRFSPPQIDSPPLTHREMSFDGSNSMLMDDANNYHDQPQSSFQQPHPPQYDQQANQEKFDRRKISVHANFYDYNMPYEKRPREHQNYNQNMDVRWNKRAREMQISNAQRKFSQPAEMMLSPQRVYDQSQYQNHPMLSPQPMVKKEVKFEDTPMETESVRKKSSLLEHSPPRENSGAPKRHVYIPTRKASQMATKSQLRAPRFGETTTKYTPPPILSPMRNGTGLFWQACKGLAQSTAQVVAASGSAAAATDMIHNHIGGDAETSDDSPGLKIDETNVMTSPSSFSYGAERNENGPARKKGFFYMAAQMNQPNFADELEALRKESYASTSSHRSGEDSYRNFSSNFGRKDSNASMCELDDDSDDMVPPSFSDATPHINIGTMFQAKVYKWKDREISDAERETIEDKDVQIFSAEIMSGIDKKQVEAYELLACSQAVPSPGKNKELALNLLMENKGNIEAAVGDLLRSDTLDWEQYPVVFGASYSDTSEWTPEQINSFQDSIYKSEKDFHQVSQEIVGVKTVKECIEFYYNWKKACPEDYRKLRNLRRKRQLLEINMQHMEDGLGIKKVSLEETKEEEIEILNQTNAGHPAFQGLQEYLAESRSHANSFSGLLAMASPLAADAGSGVSAFRSTSPKPEFPGIQRNYQPSVPRASISSSSKKGAQPSADGFFHCRLCDKCFEKVKSLNAHMKSHAMKARAEAEAKAQVDAQLAAQNAQVSQASFPNGARNLGNLPATLQGLTQGVSPNNNQLSAQNLTLTQSLLSQQRIPGLPQRNVLPILQQHLNHTTQIIN